MGSWYDKLIMSAWAIVIYFMILNLLIQKNTKKTWKLFALMI
jgi:hypothetical protein